MELDKLKFDTDTLKAMLSDSRTMEMVGDAIRKATLTNATYAFSPESRSIFTAENLDSVIKLITPTSTPIRSLLPRKAGAGQATAWKKMTSRLDPQAGGTGTSAFFADGGTPNQTAQTYATVTAAYKLLGRKLSVGLLAIASGKGYTSIEDEQIRVKTLEVMLGEEDAIINGDVDADPYSFNGLLAQITTNSGTASLLTASGIQNYDSTIFDKGGMSSHCFMGARQSKAISDELQGTGSINRIVISDQGAAVANMKVNKIISSASGSEIQLVISRYMGAWAILGALKSPAGENTVEMEDLIPLIKMDVPVTTFAKDSFVVESTVLKLIAEPWFMKISGLATS